jgi:uncharacterized DUF497 family protein
MGPSGMVISYPSRQRGEHRFVAVGPVGSRFYAVVWIERDDATRLI